MISFNKIIKKFIKKLNVIERKIGLRKFGNIYALFASIGWFFVNFITKEYELKYESNIILLYLSYG